MNIILESQITPEIRDRHILLELDSFRLAGLTDPVPAYCLLEKVGLDEMMVMKQYLDLHGNLMHNYRTRNWNYVEQAIEYLMGKWDRQLDSFYTNLLERVKALKEQSLDDSWDGTIDRK